MNPYLWFLTSTVTNCHLNLKLLHHMCNICIMNLLQHEEQALLVQKINVCSFLIRLHLANILTHKYL